MSPFRRVFGERAGPAALGILVPPGRRTLVILRPRALAWDLLLTHSGADLTSFCELERDAAEGTAEALCRALEEWAAGGPGRVDAVPLPGVEGHGVRVETGPFALVVCPRRPGEPYRPEAFASPDEARRAAQAIRAVLRPAAGAVQEVYFNTRNFTR